MKLVTAVLFLSLCFQTLHLTIAKKDDSRLSVDDLKPVTRTLQDNDTTPDAPIPVLFDDVNGTESNSTESESPTSAPSAVVATTTPTLEATLNATDETDEDSSEVEEESSGLATTDIALIVMGLIGIGSLLFGLGGSFLSGGKNVVNPNATPPAPAPTSAAPAAAPAEVEIAEA
ncbi:MAG: hypothetical protein SGBAC_005587 [Bacillariaceae sp.]